jgi:hypothetical protein
VLQAQAAPWLASGKDTARRSLGIEHLWRTLFCPTCRDGVAFLLEYNIQPCRTCKTTELRFTPTYTSYTDQL